MRRKIPQLRMDRRPNWWFRTDLDHPFSILPEKASVEGLHLSVETIELPTERGDLTSARPRVHPVNRAPRITGTRCRTRTGTASRPRDFKSTSGTFSKDPQTSQVIDFYALSGLTTRTNVLKSSVNISRTCRPITQELHKKSKGPTHQFQTALGLHPTHRHPPCSRRVPSRYPGLLICTADPEWTSSLSTSNTNRAQQAIQKAAPR